MVFDQYDSGEDRTDHFFAYDLRSGRVVEDPGQDDIAEWRIRYFPHQHGNWATIGDGLRHTVWFQDYHWDRLLQIIREDELDQSGQYLILNAWLEIGFPDDKSKKTFVSAIKSGIIKPVKDYLPRTTENDHKE